MQARTQPAVFAFVFSSKGKDLPKRLLTRNPWLTAALGTSDYICYALAHIRENRR